MVLSSRLLVWFSFLLFGFATYAQQITTDTSFTPAQLIDQALGQSCIEISNVSSSINGSVDGINSFGAFQRNGSNFPFENGIFLTSGNANSAGNSPITTDLSEGTAAWGTDPDLETALGTTNTSNATVLEFDLISVTNQISFNYLLASEEYAQDYPCNYSDGFVLLIRPTGSAAPYTNIALIPGTTTPVNTMTIRPEITGFCGAQNESFFAGYDLGDTNYNGRTVVLSASSAVVPNQSYHIKLIIADQDGQGFDSAVFIQSNSLNADVDLGPDQTPCDSATLNADVGNPQAMYQWFLNGSAIGGATNATYVAATTGTYSVDVTIPLPSSTCLVQDEVVVTINPDQLNATVPNLVLCDDPSNDGIAAFDLMAQAAAIEATLAAGTYDFSFHLNQVQAENDTNPLPNTYTNLSSPQTIFVRIDQPSTGCQQITPFTLTVNPAPALAAPFTQEVCDDNIADGITPIDLSSYENAITLGSSGLNISYHNSQADADSGSNPLPVPYTNLTNPETVYVSVVNPGTGCRNTTNITFNIVPAPTLATDTTFIDACDTDHDGFAIFDLTSVANDFTMGLSNITVSYHLSQQDAIDNLNPIASPTVFANTTQTMQSIYIRVENNLTGCASVGVIQLFTNYLLDATRIIDITTCDDPSNDGVEDFSFPAIAALFMNGLPNITIAFYETQADQLANTNPLDPTSIYFNTTNPQTLYIAISNPTCTEYADFDLVVYPSFEMDPIPNQTYCDTDQDGFTPIDLTVFDNSVRGTFDATYSVGYFENQSDADFNVNPVSLYTNTTNPVTLIARLTDTNGCYDTEPITIEVLPAPIATVPTSFVICDTDQDGLWALDLTSKISEIVTSTANRNFEFYTSQSDAEAGTNVIPDPTNYSAGTGTAYVKVINATTSCFTIVPQAILVNTLPNFPTITPYQICETDGNNIEDFFFDTKDMEILNGQTGKEVSYYLNQADANAKINSIDKTAAYANISNPQTIWTRVENTSDINCFGTASFLIQVEDEPLFNIPVDVVECDDNNDAVFTFDLQPTIDQIGMGQPFPLTVSFHLSNSDALNDLNDQGTMFTNTSNPQTLYARIGNAQNCIVVQSFNVAVIDSPDTNPGSPITLCDTDYDETTFFDLTIRQAEIEGPRPNNIVTTYYEQQADAEAGINPIGTPSNYSNISNPQTVYVRVTNTVSMCYSIESIALTVVSPPVINTIPSYSICENPMGTVDLSVINDQFITASTEIQLDYFTSQADADSNMNALTMPYNYIGPSQNIFVRVSNTTTSCFVTTSFNLIIESNPAITTPSSMIACDDDMDGRLIFDLSLQNNSILGGLNPANYTVSYHNSQGDADNDLNEITAPVEATDQQVFYARVEQNTLGCFSTTSFMTVVNPLPVIPVNEQEVRCLNDLPLIVSADTGVAGETYLWSTGSMSSRIQIDTLGSYSVTVTSPQGCSATQNFTVIQSESATINFTTATNFANPNTITVEVSGTGDYLYSLDGAQPQESNVFTNVQAGYHTVSVIDANACAPVERRVLVLDYPKFFTPNADGYNDLWTIEGLDNFGGSTIHIFDRYGKLVKSLSHLTNGWDGTFNGVQLPASDYWFVLNVTDPSGNIEVKGHFSLKR